MYAEVAKILVNVKKRKEICVGFAVKPQTAKGMDTERSKCLVKVKKKKSLN